VAQLHPEARRQLKIKLARYWPRVSPNREEIDLVEMDEESARAAQKPASRYDVEQLFPDEAPSWPAAT
jgi:hypothetical protein